MDVPPVPSNVGFELRIGFFVTILGRRILVAIAATESQPYARLDFQIRLRRV